jgi:hypothetical protein
MKRCPSCNRIIDDDSQSFCPSDGSRLIADNAPASSEDPLQATIMATPSMRPSSELPPPDAYYTNSGQLNQQQPAAPAAAAAPPWPENQYQANAPWPNQPAPNLAAPPQSPTWQQTPSGALPNAPVKKGMNTKLLIGGGIGCVALLVLGVIGIALIAVLAGSSGKMNPYKGSLRDLAPSSIGDYKRTDVDTLGDRDKDGFGKVKDAIGIAYTKSGDSKVEVFIGNYDSAEDARDGLRAFRDRLSSRGWKVSNVVDKKIGWSKVGSSFDAYRSSSDNRAPDAALSDGAVMISAQASTSSPSPSKSKSPEINCWTNGSVLYAVAGEEGGLYQFEKEFDKAQK